MVLCALFTFVTMDENIKTKQQLGRQQNKLLRYRAIDKEFHKHNYREIPITVIWRNHIYPMFFISRDTLYAVLNTDIDRELEKVNQLIKDL